MRFIAFFLIFLGVTFFQRCSAEEAAVSLNVSWWTLSLGTEFPGAEGSLTSGSDASSSAFLKLSYDFSHNDTAAYIAALNSASFVSGAVADLVSSMDTVFQLRYRYSNAQIGLRFVDKNSQTFQVSSIGVPLESEGDPSSVWIAYRVQLSQLVAPYVSFWGGSAESQAGVLALPVKSISIICNGVDRSTGWLEFDSVEFYSGDENNATLANSTLLPGHFSGPLEGIVGVNIHFTNDPQALDLIEQLGMKWVRMDFAWGTIEAVPGTYSFASYDILVNLTTARSLHVLAILDYGNSYWTNGLPPTTPIQLEAWSNYVGATIEHFAGRDVIFECWNEPDIPGFWGGNPNATQYGAVLIETVGRFAESQLGSTLLSGGLSSPSAANYLFWDTLLGMDAMAGVNGWGTHLYAGGNPESRWPDTQRLQRLASDNNLGNVWCTEWGYSTTTLSATGDGMDPASLYKQALYNVRQILLAWWSNLSLMIIYDIRNDGVNTTYNEHNFGLLFNNYTAKPAYNAVAQLLSLATAGYRFVGLRSWDPQPIGLHVAEFSRQSDGKLVWVAWLSELDPDVTISIPTRLFTKATDLLGEAFAVADNTVTLTTSAPLVYLYYSGDPLAEETSTSTTTKTVLPITTKTELPITTKTELQTTTTKPPITTHSEEATTTTTAKTTTRNQHGGGCFARCSQVRVLSPDGTIVSKQLGSLQVGDLVESIDDSFQQSFSEVYYVLHDQSDLLFSVIELATATGRSIQVTPLHLLFAAASRGDEWGLQAAQHLQVGDWLLVDFQPQQIASILLHSKAVRAPLTLNHRIVVGGVASSVFSFSDDLYRPLTVPLKLVHKLAPEFLHSWCVGAFVSTLIQLTDWFEAVFFVAPLSSF